MNLSHRARFPMIGLMALILVAASASFLPGTRAQTTPIRSTNNGPPINAEAIIRSFTQKETEFRQALNNYAFKRDAIVQTIGMGGQVTGEYRRVSQFVFDDQANRYEKITFFPASTLTEVTVTQEDIEDLGGIQPFALEASKIDKYNFLYSGTEHIDELDTYVFEVAPKVMPNPKKSKERFFMGRIWVDTRDLQIVKVVGKGVPEGDQRFPTFETYREQIDGRYWFPTYTRADDNLEFPNGQTVHIRMLVRYTDFQRFGSKVKITEVGEGPGLEASPSPSPSPTPQKRP